MESERSLKCLEQERQRRKEGRKEGRKGASEADRHAGMRERAEIEFKPMNIHWSLSLPLPKLGCCFSLAMKARREYDLMPPCFYSKEHAGARWRFRKETVVTINLYAIFKSEATTLGSLILSEPRPLSDVLICFSGTWTEGFPRALKLCGLFRVAKRSKR
jgi:hypothetical protein